MKKILAIVALAATTSAFAATGTLEYQSVDGVQGAANQNTFGLSVKESVNKNLALDVGFSNTQTEGTNALTTRLEAGATVTTTMGVFSPYVRVAGGQKFSNTKDFTYYSVEPGVSAPVGPFTAKLGYRFRDAVDNTVNADQTRTIRASVSYPFTKNDSVSLGFDRVRGDSTQDITKVSYSRSF